ncbi:hypothetical protein PV326_002270 [Microctonus aethiopoides]|nr:hypothetical protein PV326_002270 [Microctonus aethiopoides]
MPEVHAEDTRAVGAQPTPARGGRGPKAGTDKELVNALFRANGSVRAASPCSVRGKVDDGHLDQFVIYCSIVLCVFGSAEGDGNFLLIKITNKEMIIGSM